MKFPFIRKNLDLSSRHNSVDLTAFMKIRGQWIYQKVNTWTAAGLSARTNGGPVRGHLLSTLDLAATVASWGWGPGGVAGG
jgi:hypothetical protein